MTTPDPTLRPEPRPEDADRALHALAREMGEAAPARGPGRGPWA